MSKGHLDKLNLNRGLVARVVKKKWFKYFLIRHDYKHAKSIKTALSYKVSFSCRSKAASAYENNWFLVKITLKCKDIIQNYNYNLKLQR